MRSVSARRTIFFNILVNQLLIQKVYGGVFEQERHNRSQNVSACVSAMICTYCNYARILLQFTVSERYGMCTARRECDIAIITDD